ncbi:hypothetical protein [Priestia megaterium]|uniref:hypothetical protein n=1 Tax=Priestia megaterium TaxID=1404 RepID=UPI003CC60F09
MTNKKMTNDDFKYISKFPKLLASRADKKKLKFHLLNQIKAVFGDKFHNLKQGSQDAFEEMCFLSVNRGFFFAKDVYFAEKHNVGKSTINRNLKTLCDERVLVKKYRTSRKQNGFGNVVYFFVDHPYFEYWKEYFEFDEMTNVDSHEKSDDDDNPPESKSESPKLDSNMNLPNLLKESFNKQADVKIAKCVIEIVKKARENGTIINYLDEYINKVMISLNKKAQYELHKYQKAIMKQTKMSERMNKKPLLGDLNLFKGIIDGNV